MVSSIHIYDLDGTVIDSSHRYRTIRQPDGSLKIDLAHWLNNVHRADADSLLPLADQVQRQLDDPHTAVMVATARQMSSYDWAFIDRHFGRDRFDAFISRRPGDYVTKGADMKAAGLLAVIDELGLSHVVRRFFYEDNRDYLHAVANAIGAWPVYIPSEQGY